MRHRLARFVTTLVLAVLLWIPTHAAAPAIVVIYGEPLERPLL